MESFSRSSARPQDQPFNMNNFFSSLEDKLEKPVRQHLKNVYASLAICMLAAAIGGYIHLVVGILQGNFLTALVSIGLLIALRVTPPNRDNEKMRLGILTGFAFFTGLGLGPVMDMVIRIDPSIIPTAFLGTCLIFACFTGAALYSDQRKYLYLGGILMSVLSWMMMASLANLFMRSYFIYQAQLYLGLAVMCAFILYDTQLIVEKRRRGDCDYIWHSVDLFIDFVQIFRKLMIILAQKEQNNKKRR